MGLVAPDRGASDLHSSRTSRRKVIALKRRRCSLRCLLAAVATALFAGTAQAGYWNVYQGNLPDSSGVRHKTGVYLGGGEAWYVRMSWTSGSHDMYFLFIDNGGSWHSYWSYNGTQVTGPYDRVLGYVGNLARGGCQNPGGYSTVFVNCRFAGSI
jgi:hypothetical protein